MLNLDDKDRKIVTNRAVRRAEICSPVVGDVIYLPSGEKRRLCVINDGGSAQYDKAGSYYLHHAGTSIFSGSCGFDLFNLSELVRRNQNETAEFWVYHHGIVGGDRSVYFEIDVKSWDLKQEPMSCKLTTTDI